MRGDYAGRHMTMSSAPHSAKPLLFGIQELQEIQRGRGKSIRRLRERRQWRSHDRRRLILDDDGQYRARGNPGILAIEDIVIATGRGRRYDS
jgi:hypothetical protein